MMFGHHDNNSLDTLQQDTNSATATAMPPPATGLSGSTDAVSVSPPSLLPSPTPSVSAVAPAIVPSAPVIPDNGLEATSNPLVAEQQNTLPSVPGVPSVVPSVSVTPAVAATPTPPLAVNNDDLLTLKQTALGQLAPLVDHLDQTPEEKFRTTMMMIQANDNQALLKNAYDAAQAIPDDKVRAQALLDVVNEINYFTQKTSDDTAGATQTDPSEGAI